MFRSRNREVSLQPVGTSKTHRPKDATLAQHQAATWLAAELLVRARERRGPTHAYVPLAIAGARVAKEARLRGHGRPGRRLGHALIPRQSKRRCGNIRPLNERAQALLAARTASRSIGGGPEGMALTAATMALRAAQAATEAAQLQAAEAVKPLGDTAHAPALHTLSLRRVSHHFAFFHRFFTLTPARSPGSTRVP